MSDLFDGNGLAIADCTVTVSNYNSLGEYLSTTQEVIKRGVGLPASATLVPVIDKRAGYACVFDRVQNTWSYIEDHRGTTVYNIVTGYAAIVTDLGKIDTAQYTTEKPVPVPPPLRQLATTALADARSCVMNNYYLLGESVPADWVAYQKALIAISSGADTTSTTLPTAPAA